jgi:AcrR family transcriptional regulator
VNKLEKRKQIAKSCCNLFLEYGFNNISVNSLAKNAGIAKGTVYEYFSSKEDIILELMCCLQEEYDKKVLSKIRLTNSNQENLFIVFEIFFNDSQETIVQRDIFKQFIIQTLNDKNDILKKYYTNFRAKYIQVINSFLSNITQSTLIYDEVISCFINSLLISEYDMVTQLKNLFHRY